MTRATTTCAAVLAAFGALAALGVRDAAAQPTCGRPTTEPATTSHGAVAALGKHLYWIAGTDGAPGTDARRFDVKTKRWETIPEPGGGRIHPALVAAGGALYLIGGVGSSLTGFGDVQRFDPKACRWVSLGMLPWAPGSPMAAAAGDRVVVAGGRVDNGARALHTLDIWSADQAAAIDASGKVTKLPALAVARQDGAAVAVGKDVWVLGGRRETKGQDSYGSTVDDVEVLAPGAKAWTSGPELPFRAEVYAVALPDKTVVAFGRSVLESKKPAIYDPAKRAWRTGKDRPEKLEFLEGAAVIGGVIYVIGKEIETDPKHPLDSPTFYRVATYDPRKDRWVIVDEREELKP